MQILNALPRDAFTADEIHDLLTGDQVAYSAGLELLDSSNNLVSDISNNLVSGEIDRDNNALVHGTCKLIIEGELAWGKDRIRPYMTVSNGAISARFNLGVFVMTSPDCVRGEDPVTYDVTGYDLLYLLQDSIADTYVVNSGTSYLAAIQTIITASGIGATIQLDGTLSAVLLPTTMVWALNPAEDYTWIRVINDLLSPINYRPLWADENGILQSGPYIAPSDRGVEWTFDTSDMHTNIVGPARTLGSDVWGCPNYWKFIQKAMTVQPTIGAGIYEFNNTVDGRTSQAAMERIIRAKPQYLDAADQTSLVAQGNQIIAKDQAISRSFQINVDALPVAGHADIVQFNDAGESDKCQVTGWVLPLDGSQGRWTLESVVI